MITLYVRTGCGYCKKVLDFAHAHGIEYTLKDIAKDIRFAQELIALGGKRQVPHLIDSDTGAEMYESKDIIAYLAQKVPEGTLGNKEESPLMLYTDGQGGTCKIQ